jgi:hypothetical protein
MWIVVRPSLRVTCFVDSLTVTVASSVKSINGSNWQLVCKHWQNSRRLSLPLGVDFAHAVGERVQAVFMQCSPYTCSWNIETCRKFSLSSSRATLYHFKNVFLFIHMLLTCPFRWNMRTGKVTIFTQCIKHLVKHSTIRNSAHRKPSTEFFNSNSDTIIAEAVHLQHISIFGICEEVRHFSQHSYNVMIRVTTASWCFTAIHMLQTLAQYGGRGENYWAPNPKHCTIKFFYLGNLSKYETCKCTHFCLEWPILWPSRILTFPPGTLCIWAGTA